MAPRQNGKNVEVEIRELYGLYVLGEELQIHTAHEFKTCKESYRRLLQHIDGSHDLSRKVRKVLSNNQETGIELTTGQRIRFIARKANTGRGFTADLLVFDEAFALQADSVGAVLPTLATRPNPQVWYTSSAGFSHSDHLKALRARALAGGDPHLSYVEYSAPDEAFRSMDDRRWWFMANPAMSSGRISEEFVAREYSTLVQSDPRQFARERLGIWSDETVDTVIDQRLYAAALRDDVAPSAPLVLAVEVHGDSESSAIVVCGGGVLEVVEHRAGVEWVPGRLRELWSRHGAVWVVLDGSGPAKSLIPDLAGLPLVKLGPADMSAACVALLGDFVDGNVAIRSTATAAGLSAAVKVAQKQPAGATWVWRRGDDDISPLIAATAAWWQGKQPPPRPGIVSLAD